MTEFNISGVVTSVTNKKSGRTKNEKDYKSYTVTVKETDGQYPNEVALDYMVKGERMKFYKEVNVGDEVEVAFKISQNEYNGKKYNRLSVWKMNILSETTASSLDSIAGNDDLPF